MLAALAKADAGAFVGANSAAGIKWRADKLEEALWQGVGELRQATAATGTDLSAKFAAEADFELAYGSVEVFFSGVEGLLGPPSMHVMEGMEREHCSCADSDTTFSTSKSKPSCLSSRSP